MDLKKKQELRQRRVWRVRKKIQGTAERPRLCVSFSNAHIYAQAIDDESGRTLASVSTVDKDVRGDDVGRNVATATRLGKLIAEKATAAGIASVVFDRHGRLYHGRVKAFADAAREGGLQF